MYYVCADELQYTRMSSGYIVVDSHLDIVISDLLVYLEKMPSEIIWLDHTEYE